MKKLMTALTILILSVPALAGAPSPLSWGRQQYFDKSKEQHKIEIVNYDHEMANLMNQVYDLQKFNGELLAENANLRANPETVYIEKEIEKPVPDIWSVLGGVVFGVVLGAIVI